MLLTCHLEDKKQITSSGKLIQMFQSGVHLYCWSGRLVQNVSYMETISTYALKKVT